MCHKLMSRFSSDLIPNLLCEKESLQGSRDVLVKKKKRGSSPRLHSISSGPVEANGRRVDLIHAQHFLYVQAVFNIVLNAC